MEWSLNRGIKLTRTKTQAFLKRFHREEDGVFVIYSVYTFLIMIVFAGMAVDIMRVETRRSELQATADRAVLAAADMQQQFNGNAVIEDYFAKADLANTLVDYNTTSSLSSRKAWVEAQDEVPMIFGGLLSIFDGAEAGGMSQPFTVKVRSTAEEAIDNVEISLVLDISGSMGSSNRIQYLRAAAKEFVDTMLTDNEASGKVTINLVPYSEHVNLGPDIFDALPHVQKHSYSYCVEVPDELFSQVNIDPNYEFVQDQFFQWQSSGGKNRIDNPICPFREDEEVTVWSQNAAALKSQIDALQPRTMTSIFMGMKWGAAFLDPSTQSVNAALINKGLVNPAAAGRPTAYNTNALKAIVLMTDGENTSSQRIADWAYSNVSQYEHWATYNFDWYLKNYVSSRDRKNWYYTKYYNSLGDQLQTSICTAAKDAGILIWTIGLEVTDSGATKMRDCASSPSHFHRVQGLEISDAFRAIAADISALRLVE